MYMMYGCIWINISAACHHTTLVIIMDFLRYAKFPSIAGSYTRLVEREIRRLYPPG